MTMVLVFARRDTQEPNAMNAKQIFLEPSVISVMQPSMIIHPARVCLRNSFVASLNSYYLLFQSVNVTLMDQLLCNVMAMGLVLASRDSMEKNVMLATLYIMIIQPARVCF